MTPLQTTEYFSVEHASSCNVPGYLIIEPLTPVAHIWMLPERAQGELGRLQARCAQAIHEVLAPLRIYCLSFAEERLTYHCHIFPRSVEATAEYIAEFPERTDSMTGPLFFDWARKRYRADVSHDPAISKVIGRLRPLI